VQRAPRTVFLALAALLVASGWLRAIHADFGLPHRWHPDETRAASDVIRLSRGALTLPHYKHPPLLKLLAAAVVATWERLGRFDRKCDAVLALRSVSVVAGTLTVLLLYVVARRFLGPVWSLAATAIYAAFPLAVVQAKYGVPDALMSALFLAGLWTQIRLYKKPSATRYLTAGLVLMLAVAAKYNAIFLLVSLLTAHFLAAARHDRTLGAYPTGRMAAACVAGAAIGFLAGFPFVPFGDLGVVAALARRFFTVR
jgi:uncharacterized membrane protein